MAFDDIPTIGARAAEPDIKQVIEQFIMPGMQGMSMKLKEIEKRLAFIENQPAQQTHVIRLPDTLKIKLIKDEGEKV